MNNNTTNNTNQPEQPITLRPGQIILFHDGSQFIITAITGITKKSPQITLKKIKPEINKSIRYNSTLSKIQELLSINFVSLA